MTITSVFMAGVGDLSRPKYLLPLNPLPVFINLPLVLA